MRAPECLTTTFAFALLGAAARGAVIVVDAGGSGQFTQISNAVSAAQDGDTILVKSGSYQGFLVSNKSLTIVADSGADVTLWSTVKVLHLASIKKVVLAGLRMNGTTTDDSLPDEDETGLYVSDNSGPVRIEDCRIEGGWAFWEPYCGCQPYHPCNGGIGAIVVNNAAGVAFDQCTIIGGSSVGMYGCICEVSPPTSRDGNTGLYAANGIVALYDCTVWGGRGGPSCNTGGHGGDGARATFLTTLTGLVLSGCTISGGWGGGDPESGERCLHGGDGGDGLRVNPGTAVWQLETAITGGPGFQGSQSQGQSGQAIVNLGQLFPFTVPRLRLEIPSLVREQQNVPVTVRGRAGDEIYVYMGPETPFRALASWHGVLLANSPHPQLVGILGTIPPSGVLSTSFRFPDLGLSVTARNWFIQAWRNSPIDGRTLGGFRVLTVLDSAY